MGKLPISVLFEVRQVNSTVPVSTALPFLHKTTLAGICSDSIHGYYKRPLKGLIAKLVQLWPAYTLRLYKHIICDILDLDKFPHIGNLTNHCEVE